MPLPGRCACGATRFQLERAPMFVHGCHCTHCQRETGSAFAVNGLLERAQITLLAGEPESNTLPTASGLGQRVHRCPECHVALWSHYAYGTIGDLLAFVRVGTLDPGHGISPDLHIFTASKVPWLTLPDEAPAVPQYYRARDHWPAEALERRAALFP